MKPLLLLSTLHRNHAAHSAYQALASALPEAQFLTAIRSDPPGGLPLFAARVARRLSFSRWYLGGCAEMEWKALRVLRSGFSGIIHSMWADHDLGFLDLALDRKRQRFVGSFHNCDDTFIHTIRFPRRLRRFDAIILMSRTQEQFFLDAGVAPERIHVVLHGVDTAFFRPPETRVPGHVFTVVAAGGYRRNFPLLREVCMRFRDEPVRFIVVGPEAWRHLFADLSNVDFRSGLGDADYLGCLQTSDCLLQTVENATANNVILEGMACGLPVVAERIGGIPEYVDPSCSVLTSPGDSDALATAIRDLQHDAALRETLSRGARARAEQLNWNAVAGRMRAIYAQL